jgi:selenoprotein W-related protein
MTARPVKVTIAYCSECGYESQTLALAGALMTAFGHQLSSVELIPWFDGSFDVSVAGQLVHSMMREGGFPEHATIIETVRRHLKQGAAERAPVTPAPAR